MSDDADDETTLACPDCDSGRVRRLRSASMNRRSDTNAPEHWCRECEKAVEPTERVADPSGGALQGLSKRLDEMDADDVGEPCDERHK